MMVNRSTSGLNYLFVIHFIFDAVSGDVVVCLIVNE